MPITTRPLKGDIDFWKIHRFLLDVYRSHPPGYNWDIRRWEGKYLYGDEVGWDTDWQARAQAWEADGAIIGVAHPDSGHHAALRVRLRAGRLDRAAAPDASGTHATP